MREIKILRVMVRREDKSTFWTGKQNWPKESFYNEKLLIVAIAVSVSFIVNADALSD
jgi:hypothetical protein